MGILQIYMQNIFYENITTRLELNPQRQAFKVALILRLYPKHAGPCEGEPA
jgi:hypothetical protein